MSADPNNALPPLTEFMPFGGHGDEKAIKSIHWDGVRARQSAELLEPNGKRLAAAACWANPWHSILWMAMFDATERFTDGVVRKGNNTGVRMFAALPEAGQHPAIEFVVIGHVETGMIGVEARCAGERIRYSLLRGDMRWREISDDSKLWRPVDAEVELRLNGVAMMMAAAVAGEEWISVMGEGGEGGPASN